MNSFSIETIQAVIIQKLGFTPFGQIKAWACFAIRDKFARDPSVREIVEIELTKANLDELKVWANEHLLNFYKNFYSDSEFNVLLKNLEANHETVS